MTKYLPEGVFVLMGGQAVLYGIFTFEFTFGHIVGMLVFGAIGYWAYTKLKAKLLKAKL